jgi:hypothetical protein
VNAHLLDDLGRTKLASRESLAAIAKRARAIATWRHFAYATAFAVALGISRPFQGFEMNLYWAPWRILYHTPWLILYAYVFVLAIVAAEASDPNRSGPSTWRYAGAVVVASVITLGIAAGFSEYFQVAPKRVQAGREAPRTDTGRDPVLRNRVLAVAGSGFDGVLFGSLATFIYVRQRRSRLAMRALADAQIARSEAMRTLLASQLAAARAKVDPAFVFQTLEMIERTYETSPGRADVLLDELTAFLRAAIPRLRAEETPGSVE